MIEVATNGNRSKRSYSLFTKAKKTDPVRSEPGAWFKKRVRAKHSCGETLSFSST